MTPCGFMEADFKPILANSRTRVRPKIEDQCLKASLTSSVGMLNFASQNRYRICSDKRLSTVSLGYLW